MPRGKVLSAQVLYLKFTYFPRWREPMFAFAFEAALFVLNVKKPPFEPLSVFPPTFRAVSPEADSQ